MSERTRDGDGEERLARLLDTVPPRVAVPALPGALSLVEPLAARTYPSPALLARIDGGTLQPSPVAAALRALDAHIAADSTADTGALEQTGA